MPCELNIRINYFHILRDTASAAAFYPAGFCLNSFILYRFLCKKQGSTQI
jgi:hypothetical protein